MQKLPAHIFVCKGDLTKIACDHWLIPVDSRIRVSRFWWSKKTAAHLIDAGAWGASGEWGQNTERAQSLELTEQQIEKESQNRNTYKNWQSGPVVELPNWCIDRAPQPWLVRISSSDAWDSIDYAIENIKKFVHRSISTTNRFLKMRARPLLAIPLVGTGHGGNRYRSGVVVSKLLPELQAVTTQCQVDVVIVTHTDEDYAAVQHERRSFAEKLWTSLTVAQRKKCASLAAKARRGELVLFLGAGVSMGAGLPGWGQLLTRLAEAAGISDERFSELSLLDQAEFIDYKMKTSNKDIGKSIQDIFNEYTNYGLSHSLLASLPANQTVTTNYDTLFEQASRDAKREITVLPYSPTQTMERWLLKMHGCVEYPQDIVLTRQSYIRYAERNAALSGIVQAMLITKHMLFVGFSLQDDNFFRIIDSVRRALQSNGMDTNQPTTERRFGTALMPEDSQLYQELWKQDIEWLSMSTSDAEAFIQIEIFLDYLGLLSSTHQHLLSQRFEGVLDPEDQALKELLQPLLTASPQAKKAAAWPLIANLLKQLGST